MRLLRITDYVPEWDWYPHHEYAKIQPWNADGSLYKFYSVALYDARTHRMIRELPGSEIYPSYWSPVDPDLIYSFRLNGDVRIYRVSTDSVVQMDHIVDASGGEYDAVYMGPGEGNMDVEARRVALVGRRGVDMDVILYDLENFEVDTIITFEGVWGDGEYPLYVDWVSVSQSGEYIGIMWDHNTTSPGNPFDGHYGVEIYRADGMTFLRRIAEYGNHGDFCMDVDGREVFVQFWGPTGTLNMYYLDSGERVVLSEHPDFSGEGHISCRNIRRPGWAYVSQDDSSLSGQMVAVRLDASGTFEHFGHHFSSSMDYLKSPMPVPSPDGSLLMFKSDFMDTTSGVVYTFISSVYTVSLRESGQYVSGEVMKIDSGVVAVYSMDGRLVMRKEAPVILSWRLLRPGFYVVLIEKDALSEKRLLLIR